MATQARTIEADGDAAGGRNGIMRLLAAVSEELTRLAQDIERIGGALSADAAENGHLHTLAELQTFDLLWQNAQSQARLLHELTEQMGTHAHLGEPDLNGIIQHIPFHSVRLRLNAALHGGSDVAASLDDEDGADWF